MGARGREWCFSRRLDGRCAPGKPSSRAAAQGVVCLGKGLEAQRGESELTVWSYESWPFSTRASLARDPCPRPAAKVDAACQAQNGPATDATSRSRPLPQILARRSLENTAHCPQCTHWPACTRRCSPPQSAASAVDRWPRTPAPRSSPVSFARPAFAVPR